MYLSIIIPTYNRHSDLSICLKSLADQIQHNTDFEVIVVDDCSSKKIASCNQSLCNLLHFSYFYHDKNLGSAQARNTGVFNSHGKWIAFLDDDVQINENWLNNILLITPHLSQKIIGIEGLVRGSGDGLWDREVQNLHGHTYLTCNYLIRRDILILVGGFDTNFSGPFGEDHELTVRLQKHGVIQFEKSIAVTHLPRNISFFNHIKKSPWRMRTLLRSEYYFFSKHPDDYSRFRHATSFQGTYKSILFRHVFNSLRRRSFLMLTKHPFQTFILLVSSIIEQVSAWFFLPQNLRLIKTIKNKNLTFESIQK